MAENLQARSHRRIFFFVWEARKQPHPSAADRVRGGGTAPQIHMQVGPHSSRCCRKGPQGATPRTRPPAPPPLGRRPQAAWSAHCTTRRPRTLVPAPSIKRISSSNPEGPLRDGCRRPAPPCTLGFSTLTLDSLGRQPRETQRQPLPLPLYPNHFFVPSRQVVPPARAARYTPRRAVPSLSQHEFSCPALAARLQGPQGATPGARPLAPPLLGRRPQAA